MVNAYWEALSFEIPPVDEGYESWRCCIDTFLDSPADIYSWTNAPLIQDSTYLVQPHSIVLLFTRSLH
jgi:pullulanase/glycogen debranching enzyme